MVGATTRGDGGIRTLGDGFPPRFLSREVLSSTQARLPIHAGMSVWHWILHITGADNVSGQWYGFWSGFGSDLPIFGAIAIFLHHHNCAEPRCWRIGKAHRQHKCKRHYVPTERSE